MDKRPARGELSNRAREIVEHYGLEQEYRLLQEAHGRHLGSGNHTDFEVYQEALHNLLSELAVRALDEGRHETR